MALDVTAIQAALADEGVDGWLLYDFHGSNPIATRLAGLNGTGKMTTRRWYYLVPRTGTPRKLVHAIESRTLHALPGDTLVYAGRAALERHLATLLGGLRRVAMEFSPDCAIPYVSRVDAGTVDLVRKQGIDVVSSGDLIQRFEASWSPAQLATHREASDKLYRVKDVAFAEIAAALRNGSPITEFDIQQRMVRAFKDEGLIADAPPMVAAMENAGDPHYLPTRERHRPIRRNELVLLDLWGKLPTPGAVFADISWTGFTGTVAPTDIQTVFDTVARARDAALQFVQDGARHGRDMRGWQVDQAARRVLEEAGYGNRILHRTGHSLGEEVHGNAVHMDDYETHDDRRLLPGLGFTIEPGLYFETFGLRSEINVYVSEHDAQVSGPIQDRLVMLDVE
jgi:Xaa-Pro dipeptidase